MGKRRLPRPKDLAPFLRVKPPSFGTQNRLKSAYTIEDLRNIAKRRTPRAAFDYTDGGADAELSLRRSREAFRSLEFQPAILRNVSSIDTSQEIFGNQIRLPFGIAPTGFTRLMHTEGEKAGAAAAAQAGIPFCLSTMATTSIEDVRSTAPNGEQWFQLYIWKDRERTLELIQRAAQTGVQTLVVTVDVPVAGARLRDQRNGFSIPPQLSLRTIIDALPRPWWWFDFLTTEPLSFASLNNWPGTIAELLDEMFDPTVTYEDLKWIREHWQGSLVVKGVQTVDDAKRLVEIGGVDGIILSNHGGRQLDRAPVPFHLLPAVVESVGSEITIGLDTGIMNGADIVASVAMGASFTLIGKAYLYGLMAGGKLGVDRTIQILEEQIIRTMRLLGVTSLSELNPDHVRQGGVRRGSRPEALGART